MHKAEILMPIFLFIIVSLLGSINATIGIVGGVLSIYYTSLKLYEHYKEKKKVKSIFKSNRN